MGKISKIKRSKILKGKKANLIQNICKKTSNSNVRLRKLRIEELDLINDQDIDLEIRKEDKSLISYFEFQTITIFMRIFRSLPGYNFIHERILCVSLYLLVRLLGKNHRESEKILKIFDTYTSRTAWKWLKEIQKETLI